MKNGIGLIAASVVAGIALGGVFVWFGLSAWLGLSFAALATAAWLALQLSRAHTRISELTSTLRREQVVTEEAHAFTREILDVIPMPIYVKDADSRYIIVNQAHARQVARNAEDMIGQCSFDLAPNIDVAAASREEDIAVLGGAPLVTEKHMIDTPTGQEQFMVVTKGRCLKSEGDPVIVCSFFDATAWRLAERKSQEALERETLLRERTQDFIQRLIDVIPDPFYVKDAHSRVLLANSALARERNTTKEALVGRDAKAMTLDKKRAEEASAEDMAVIGGAEIDKEQYLQKDPMGQERFRHIIKRRCVHIDGDPVIVAASFNITRWKIAERELARVAHQDMLTGLPNRRGFLESAIKAISRAERHDEALSLLLFDLDHFKNVNDTHGHSAGDNVLQLIGDHLRNELRTEDLPCRWGGEEFAVLLPLTSSETGMQVAQRLRCAIEQTPIQLQGSNALKVTISCGVAQQRKDETLDQLINRADAALYEAKHAGRNNCLLAA